MRDAPPRPYRVGAKRRETHDTWTLELEPEHEPGPRFEPGQFVMLYAFGAGEAPVSISGGEDDRLLQTVRAVGHVTRALCAAEPGDLVGVRGPFGTGWPVEAARGHDVVFVAGGLGLPPLRPAILRLLAERDRYGRVSVLYGGRAPGELLFTDELEDWRTSHDVAVEVTVDAPAGGWNGRVGVVPRLVRDAAFEPADTVAMACGPEVMMRFTATALRDRGVAAAAIWLSLERSMHCGVGHCGHCQLGPLFMCKDGPVVRHDVVEPLLRVREL
jgi:NAD(P)H-flavin reductase